MIQKAAGFMCRLAVGFAVTSSVFWFLGCSVAESSVGGGTTYFYQLTEIESAAHGVVDWRGDDTKTGVLFEFVVPSPGSPSGEFKAKNADFFTASHVYNMQYCAVVADPELMSPYGTFSFETTPEGETWLVVVDQAFERTFEVVSGELFSMQTVELRLMGVTVRTLPDGNYADPEAAGVDLAEVMAFVGATHTLAPMIQDSSLPFLLHPAG